MQRIKLTPSRMATFTCPADKQQAFMRDSEQPGLALRATAGSKSYVFQGKLNGQVVRMTIGDLKTWSLDEARKEARRLKGMVDEGRDPRQVKAEVTAAHVAARQKATQDKTPALEAWQAYIQARAPRWSERHKTDHESMASEGGEKITRGRRTNKEGTTAPGMLRPLLELPLQAITRDRVAVWLEDEAAKRPARARLALSLLGTFLTWCGDRPDYRAQVNPDACARMKRELPKAQVKEDCLQKEQLEPWFAAVRALPNPTIAAYLQCLLLVGCRKNELAELQWDNVDFQWKALIIKDKVEGERNIPLTPHVAALLQDLKRRNENPPVRAMGKDGTPWKPSPWVFASPTATSGRIQEPRIAHNRALAAAGLPSLSLHGLRRSFGTLAEWVEAPAGVVAQIMGHKPSAIAEKHYRRRPLDLLRMWHVKIEAWIIEQAGIEQSKAETPTLKSITAA